jgi:DNA replication protein DnaC
MAEAVDLAKLHGQQQVERALAACAHAHRFGEGDLAAILTHQTNGEDGATGDPVPRQEPCRAAHAAALDALLGGVRSTGEDTMSVKTPTPPPLPQELEGLLRRLRLPYVRRCAPEVLATATAQRWEPAEVLRVLLVEEAAGRDQATIRNRRRASALPAGKTFDAWEQDASAIPKTTQQALRTLEWIERAETLCICGPSGTGKSHFIEALGHLAIDRGKTVAFHTLETLAALIGRHRPDQSVAKAIGRLIRADLIVCDLGRPRDYADTRHAAVVNALLLVGFSAQTPDGLSA